MFSRVLKILKILSSFVVLFSLNAIAQSQFSNSLAVRSLGYIPAKISSFFGVDVFRLIIYSNRQLEIFQNLTLRFKNKLLLRKSRSLTNYLKTLISFLFTGKRQAVKKKTFLNQRFKNIRLHSYISLLVNKSNFSLMPYLDRENYRREISNENLDANDLFNLGHQFFNSGRLDLACETFEYLAINLLEELAQEDQLHLLRLAGITNFMLGKIVPANDYWSRAGKLRRLILGEETGPLYRILGSSWFAAIGHVAMIDFYLKFNKLFRGDQIRVVMTQENRGIPGYYLLKRFEEIGIEFISSTELASDYDLWAKYHNRPDWESLTPGYRSALIDDFWEFEFPDSEVLGYTHAANKIQKEWEGQQKPPLLAVNYLERLYMNKTLDLLGVPKGAWYVCLHVRESGFHKNWNSLYPSMRDADIVDYFPAIDMIVKNGGWVIRMGDPSMTRLPENMPCVVDYSHSEFRNPKADIVLTLGCRFFLGTNSGFATIPSIFGVKCIFSNWLPIGLPLWPSKDLMQPKLFWDESRDRFLTFDEIFSSGLAFIQNWSDLPEGITLRNNSPKEILELTAEALGITVPSADKGLLDSVFKAYQQTAENNSSYCGSHLSSTFSERYSYLLKK